MRWRSRATRLSAGRTLAATHPYWMVSNPTSWNKHGYTAVHLAHFVPEFGEGEHVKTACGLPMLAHWHRERMAVLPAMCGHCLPHREAWEEVELRKAWAHWYGQVDAAGQGVADAAEAATAAEFRSLGVTRSSPGEVSRLAVLVRLQ